MGQKRQTTIADASRSPDPRTRARDRGVDGSNTGIPRFAHGRHTRTGAMFVIPASQQARPKQHNPTPHFCVISLPPVASSRLPGCCQGGVMIDGATVPVAHAPRLDPRIAFANPHLASSPHTDHRALAQKANTALTQGEAAARIGWRPQSVTNKGGSPVAGPAEGVPWTVAHALACRSVVSPAGLVLVVSSLTASRARTKHALEGNDTHRIPLFSLPSPRRPVVCLACSPPSHQPHKRRVPRWQSLIARRTNARTDTDATDGSQEHWMACCACD